MFRSATMFVGPFAGIGISHAPAGENVEWTALEHREASHEALSAFVAMVDAAGRLNIARPADSQILSLLQTHGYRETRIFQADQGLPIIIWLVLSFYAFVLVMFVLLAGTESRIVHLLFTSSFTSSVVLLLILIRMLDYPFEGALALGDSDFMAIATLLRQLSALLS